MAGTLAALTLLSAIGLAGWFMASQPEVRHGSHGGVIHRTVEHVEVRSISGPDMVVLPTDADGGATLTLSVRNDGWLPMRVLSASVDSGSCGWVPTAVEMRTENEEGVIDRDAAPVATATVPAGNEVHISIPGTLQRHDGCDDGSLILALVADVDVTVSVLGRRHDVSVPVDPALGWTDDLEDFAEREDAVIQPSF